MEPFRSSATDVYADTVVSQATRPWGGAIADRPQPPPEPSWWREAKERMARSPLRELFAATEREQGRSDRWR